MHAVALLWLLYAPTPQLLQTRSVVALPGPETYWPARQSVWATQAVLGSPS